MRTVKLDVEDQTGECFSVQLEAFSWLPTYAADCLNKFQIGDDGKTAYERVRGKPYAGEVYPSWNLSYTE